MRTLTRIKSPTCSLIANYRLRHPNQWPFSVRFSTHSSHTLENKREERSAIKHGICYSRWWWLERVWPWPVVWNVEAGVAEAFDTGNDRRLKLDGKNRALQKREASRGLRQVYRVGFAIIINPIGVKVWMISMALLALANYTIWTKQHLSPLTANQNYLGRMFGTNIQYIFHYIIKDIFGEFLKALKWTDATALRDAKT